MYVCGVGQEIFAAPVCCFSGVPDGMSFGVGFWKNGRSVQEDEKFPVSGKQCAEDCPIFFPDFCSLPRLLCVLPETGGGGGIFNLWERNFSYPPDYPEKIKPGSYRMVSQKKLIFTR